MNGQNLTATQKLNTNNGLLQNTATCLEEDEYGRIWIGTSGGIQVYNGFDLETFPQISGRVLGLKTIDSFVFCLALDAVYRFNSRSFKLKVFKFENLGFRNWKFRGDLIDIISYEGSLVRTINLNLGETKKPSDNYVKTREILNFSYFGGRLVSTNIGVVYYKEEDSIIIIKDHCTGFYKINEQEVLLATAQGLLSLNGLNVTEHFPEYSVEDVHKDNHGNIWLGTSEHGVIKVSRMVLENEFYSLKEKKEPVTCWSIFKYNEVKYVLTSNGIKRLKPALKNDILESITRDLMTVAAQVVENGLLIGTSRKGVFLFKNGKLKRVYFNNTNNLDNTAMQFVATNNGFAGVTKTQILLFSEEGKLVGNKSFQLSSTVSFLMHLRKTSYGYFGASTTGLCKYDNEFRLLQEYRTNKASIFTMTDTFNGHIYASSLDGGLFYLDKDSIIQIDFVSKNLFSVKNVNQKLWMSGSFGLYNYYNKGVRIFEHANGLPIKEFNQSGLQWINEKLYFSGVGGVFSINPYKEISELKAPSIRVNANGEFNSSVHLNSDENLLNLELEPINTMDKSNVLLQYWNKDKWSTLEKKTLVTLNPIFGKNQFKIRKFFLSDGSSEVEIIEIYRNYPFWKKSWFFFVLLTLTGLIVLGVISIVKYLNTKKLLREEQKNRKVKEERLRISRELHDNIGARLTYIISSLDMESQKEDIGSLDKLNAFTRETMGQLRETIWAVGNKEVYVSELMVRLEQLCNQAQELGKSTFDYRNEVKSDFPLSPVQTINFYRIFQEAINNITKYSKANKVYFSGEEMEGEICIKIEDNGKGFDMESIPKSGGVRGMLNRARESNAILEIESELNIGTVVKLKFVKK